MTDATKRNLRSVALAAAAFGVLVVIFLSAQLTRRSITVPPLRHDAVILTPNGTRYDVEIADDDPERMLGLSYLPSMAETEGKLFLFPAPGRPSFWMKDMRFPLDMLWIEGGVVVDLAEDVPAPLPGEFPTTVLPEADASVVLELRAGEVKRQGITRGTTLDIQTPPGYSWPAH